MTVLNLSVDDLFLRSVQEGGYHILDLGKQGVLAGLPSRVGVMDQGGNPEEWLQRAFQRGLDRASGAPVLVPGGAGTRPFLFTGVYASDGLTLASRLQLYAPSERVEFAYWPEVVAAGFLPYSAAPSRSGAAGLLGINAVLTVDPDWAYSPDGEHLFSCGSNQPVPYGGGVWVDLEEVVSALKLRNGVAKEE